MDWEAILIGAIPGIVSIILLGIQILRDRSKDAALTQKTRAEAITSDALTAKTLIEAAEQIVLRYEHIIENMEKTHKKEIEVLQARISELEKKVGSISSPP